MTSTDATRREARDLLSFIAQGESGFAFLVGAGISIAIDLVVAGAIAGVINGTTENQTLTVIGFSAALIYCGLRAVATVIMGVGTNLATIAGRVSGVGKMIEATDSVR